MYRRQVLAGVSGNLLIFSGCLTNSESGKTGSNQTESGTDSKHTTSNCWELSKRQGFRINSGYKDTVSLIVSVFEVRNQTEKRVFQESYDLEYQAHIPVRDSVFTKDTTYRVVVEGLGKTESKTIGGGDESWRLRRTVYINIQEDGGLVIGSMHIDGNIPPACE